MNTNTYTKRQHFTKTNITRALKSAHSSLDIKKIEENKCDVNCWTKSIKACTRRFDVTLKDIEVIERTIRPATFKIRICNISTKEASVIFLFIRYYFHINIDVSKISLEEMSLFINDQNLSLGPIKTVLLHVTKDGYGLCTEIRCHVSDTNDIVKCYDKYKWKLLEIPVEILKRASFYYKQKKGWDWKEKSVKIVESKEYENFYFLPPNHELAKH